MPTPTRSRILVVEDDATLRDALTAALAAEGHEVDGHADGTELPAVLAAFHPELAILDVRLGTGPSGLTIAGELRRESELPILFLSAADAVSDRVAGLRAGGDDYMVKPFAMVELLARVDALLRRAGHVKDDVRVVGSLVVDEGARAVAYEAEDVELTRTEFDILTCLARQPGKVVSKARLLADVWGFTDFDPNLVEVHVSSLRRKLEAVGPRLVQTVRGVGYVLRT